MADKKTKKKKDEQDIHVWNTYSEAEKKKVYALADDYRGFISDCKTERESAAETVRMAKAAGYIELSEAIRKKKKLKAGDKVHFEKVSIGAAQDALITERNALRALRWAMNA